MNIDETTIKIYEDMRNAFKNGNALSYANELAKKIVGQTEPRREIAVGTVTNTKPTPQPKRLDSVRIGGSDE